MSTASFLIVPAEVPVYRTKRRSAFGVWSLARKKRGNRGWAEFESEMHECSWVPTRNGLPGHWIYIDLPVSVVVDACRHNITSSVGLDDTPILETSEGTIGVATSLTNPELDLVLEADRDRYLAGMPSD